MSASTQAKILRVLQEHEFERLGGTRTLRVDVRLIAATNRIPEQAVAEGKLREDLYHRLNVFPISMPPLRDRGSDIELLAQHFLEVLNKQESAAKSFAPATVAALYAHSWPGNVRELKNYVQRAFILADGEIGVDLAPAAVAAPDSAPILTVRVGSTLDEVSRRLIEATLAECGSKRKAADMLGISLKTLYNRLAAYKAAEPDEDDDDDRLAPAREEHRRAA
jgi:two-component system response regulator AtoC